jgi:hypothetical protein
LTTEHALNNEGQECKTGPVRGRVLVSREGKGRGEKSMRIL